MQISIEALEEKRTDIVDLEDVGSVHTADDVIYFNDTPYKLSSAKPKLSSFLPEKNKLIMEIMALAYLVQTETPYCVFVHYSGHVDQIEISIRESKQTWQNTVLETQFYTDFKKLHGEKDPLAYLKAKKNVLTRILEDGEVPFDEVEAEQIVSTLYTF